MTITVSFTGDAGEVLRAATDFLASDPVRHNLVLTILHARAAFGESGRYWIALRGEKPDGVAIQSPFHFAATMTPMEPAAAGAIVHAIADAGISLPGVNGEAATAARFAGEWSGRTKTPATPFQGMRLYELLDLASAPQVEGRLRRANASDRELMIRWSRAFFDEIGEPAGDVELQVDRGIAAGQFWIWEVAEPVSMAVERDAVLNVVRVVGVYTPREIRGRGYAHACVHALSAEIKSRGQRAILYTDLANPTSNSIYQRIGYRAVSESLRYRFGR